MASLKIRELPEQERPREKLAGSGAASLTDAELIAILLRTGMQGANAVEIARRLLARHGSLAALARCSVKELAKEKGVGPTKAVQLAAAFALGARLARETISQQKLDNPELIYEMLGPEMRALNKESLRVILLDTKHHLICVEEISLGSLNETVAHPREIFRAAIAHSAYGVVVAHNHPSGDPTPSSADRQMTTRLAECARLLQINLLDHVIIGAPRPGLLPYFSFREHGMIG
ncbi:MAG: DNA repair protein RadC [Chthoniobacteraceae bacterium]